MTSVHDVSVSCKFCVKYSQKKTSVSVVADTMISLYLKKSKIIFTPLTVILIIRPHFKANFWLIYRVLAYFWLILIYFRLNINKVQKYVDHPTYIDRKYGINQGTLINLPFT